MEVQKRFYLTTALCMLIFSSLQPSRIHSAAGGLAALIEAPAVSSASLTEDFEDGVLEARITVETTGINLSQPGIQDISNFGSLKAFAFGRSTCNWGCQNRITAFKITYPEPVYIYSISFKEMEQYGNWGSGGKIYVDNVPVSPPDTRELGREPYNDRQPDTTYRHRLVLVNKLASQIEFRVNDITSDSEIFLDDLNVSGECVSTPAGMVSWWSGDGHPFDLLDENDGIWLGDPAYALGISGKAFSLDGVDDALRVSDGSSLQAIGSEFSIEAWVYPLDFPAGGSAYDTAVVERENLEGGFALATRGSSLGLWLGTGTEPGIFTGSEPVTTGSWMHLVGTYDGTQVSVYLNGALHASQAVVLKSQDQDLHIGSRHGAERFFQGLIDEIGLYSRALEAQEVLELYESGSAGKCRPCLPPMAGLAAWWPLDDGSGSVARELVNARNGALHGTTWAIGKAGTALNFDGLDDYLKLPDAASEVLLDAGGTISAWVNPAVLGDNDIIAAFGSGQDGEGIGMGIFGQVRIWHQGEAFDWQSAVLLPVSTWTFLAYTWDNAHESIYVNGDLIEHRPRNFNYIPGKARIGQGWWGQADSTFAGLVDEVQVYNRALTAEEIAALYFAGCASTCWVYHSLYLPIMPR